MEVKQIFELVNTATKEAIGESVVVAEDLSNIVSVGDAIMNANAVDKYVNQLVDHIGKVIFVNRPYKGRVPSVLMDGWEFGSVVEKVSTGLPEATENESWELEDGATYDVNMFYKPKVVVKFFNGKTTFEIPMSFTEEQVKMSFSNATQLNGFISMLYTSVENSMTVKLDSLIMRTINNMIGATVVDDYDTAGIDTKSGVKAINLLKLYNDKFKPTTPLTAEDCITNADFIKFASYIIKLTYGRMSTMSTIFNIGKQPRFTPRDNAHIVLLEDFRDAADIYLQSETFHNDLTKLPDSEAVPYWQGSGNNYEYAEVTKVDIKCNIGTQSNPILKDITVTGVLGVIFDRYALGVNNFNRRVTANYNAKAEFFNNWFKEDAQYFNDYNENFVVFFAA